MTKNEIHNSKRKKKQDETKDDVCDIGNDPIFCLTHKDTNGIESRINTITTIEYLLSCIECKCLVRLNIVRLHLIEFSF